MWAPGHGPGPENALHSHQPLGCLQSQLQAIALSLQAEEERLRQIETLGAEVSGRAVPMEAFR